MRTAIIAFFALILTSYAQTRTLVYDVETREVRNFVKFVVQTNVYMGYDLLTNPEHSLLTGAIDWSISKMAEITYDEPLVLTFENIRPWVTYTLRLSGTLAVTWPESVVFLPVGTTDMPNLNDTYQLLVFNDVETQYLVKLGASGGTAVNWSLFPAQQTVNYAGHNTTNVTQYGFTNRASLFVRGSDLIFKTGE